MNPAIEKLSKVIQLEVERDFDNGAVVGGLSRVLQSWQDEAANSGLEDKLVQAVVRRLQDYERLKPASRREALTGLWNRLMASEESIEPIPALAGEANKVAVVAENDGGQPQAAAAGQEASSPADDQTPQDEAAEDEPDLPSDNGKKLRKQSRKKGSSARKAAQAAADADDDTPAALEAPLTTIPGIGPKSAKTLAKLDLETLGDLLWHFPRRYDDYSKLETINRLFFGEDVTVIATVDEIQVRPVRSGKLKLTEAVVEDGTGSLRVTWFNQPWIARSLKPGKAVVLSGTVDQYLGKLVLNNPDWEALDREQLHTNRIVPVYPLTSGITAKWMRKVLHSVVTRLAPRVPDWLPASVIESAELMPLSEALQAVHFPPDQDALRRARHRLAFDELFLLQLGVLRQKRQWEQAEVRPLTVEETWVENYLQSLPFELTEAQARALEDLRNDLASESPMNRLLEGDVGSGKTVIAAAAIGITAANGGQSALMAPTGILAEQHYASLKDLLRGADVPEEQVQLLTGATPAAERDEIHQRLQNGEIKLLIGTHALLEDPVEFDRLELAVIDEQHRFGVEQRAALRAKGATPNLLVMTATPIPRSLALTIYGDLDLTIIDEMPPGRQPVDTKVMAPVNRARAYNFILGQLEAGRQAFVIYPLVEGSEKVQAKAAVDEHKRLQDEVFFNYQVGLLHGRMKPEEKEAVMTAFRGGQLDVLVSTSVVEVGVDIPNATVVLIEGANRFGLSQLHQFRGRVGRGQQQAYCLLIPESDEQLANERLQAMESTTDGFELADRDLEQRGPGDFFGTRQSGFAEIRMARLTDIKLIEKARRQARELFDRDPTLEQPEHELLAKAVERAWLGGKGDVS